MEHAPVPQSDPPEGALTALPFWKRIPQKLYDAAFLLGWFVCLFVGRFPQLSTPLSAVLLLTIMLCLLNENFYLYAALFLYMRYKMLFGGSPVYRIYSYLVVLRFLWEFPKSKFRVTYLPAILVFAFHSIFAVGPINMRLGLNIIVDVMIIYIVIMKVSEDDRLMRKFLLAYLLGGVCSGVYGFTAADVVKHTYVSGAISTVTRNFGALNDANYAGLFYNMAIMTALFLKNLKLPLRLAFAAFFLFLLLQTVSLSGMITLAAMSVFAIILRFRRKSLPILLIAFFGGGLLLAVLLSIPRFRQISAVSSLIIRVAEKLHYIKIGRWNQLTTERVQLWSSALSIFRSKTIWGKLFGGSVITLDLIYTKLRSHGRACHQAYIQSLVNFGIIGTLLVYIPLIAVFLHRLNLHFSRPEGYGNEDIKCIQLIYAFAFLIFGLSVDFFIDWSFMFFYFI